MPNQSQGLGNAPADGLTLEQVESVQALVSGGGIFAPGRAAAIGDSVTAYGGGSWFHQLCLYSGGKVRRAINAGVAGNTTAQMLARIVADVPGAAKPKIGFVTGGSNDLVTGISDNDTAKNILYQCRYMESIGARAVVVLPPPRSDETSYRAASAAKRAAIRAMAEDQGIVFIDPWRQFVAADSGWLAGASADGVHPNRAAAAAGGLDAWGQLSPHIGSGWDGLHGVTSSPGTLITTNDYLADANMDGAPDGWSGYAVGGLVVTRTTTPSVRGNVWRITTAGLNGSAAPVAGERVEERVLTGLTLAAGSRVAVSARVTLTGAETGISCHVRANVSGGLNAVALEPSNFEGNLSGAVVYGEGVVNVSGSTQVTLQFRLVTTGTVTPSVGYVELSEIQVWDLTAGGLLT